MKKRLACLFLICFVFVSLGSSLAYARPRPPRGQRAVKAEIRRVEAYMNKLNRKLEAAKKASRRRELNRMIRGYKRRLRKLQGERGGNAPAPELKPGKPLPKKVPPRIRPKPKKEAPQTIGLSAGLLANIPAVIGELRIKRPFELRAVTLKIGLGYARGNDSSGTTRKHLPLFLTGIYRLTPPGTPGINPYLGIGLNWNLYTTGRKAGSVGADILFGLDGNAGQGKVFAEAGYSLLRTGFSPDYQGLTFLAGYRHPWSW